MKEEEEKGWEKQRKGCDVNALSTDKLLETTKVVTCKWEDTPKYRRGLSLTQPDVAPSPDQSQAKGASSAQQP